MAPERHIGFVDESIRARSGFMVSALLVCSRSVEANVADAIRRAGLTPYSDEFKSSSPKKGNPQSAALRTELLRVVQQDDAKIALVVNRADRRQDASTLMVELIHSIRIRDRWPADQFNVVFDEGLLKPGLPHSSAEGLHLASADSRSALGIQLADLVAHAAGTIIESELGHRKLVSTPSNVGYDDVEMIDLDFELWAGLRYNLSSGRQAFPHSSDKIDFATTHPYGLKLAVDLPHEIVEAADRRLGTVYLGCIH